MTSPPRSFDDTQGGKRIPEALRRTVLKALAKEPSERQNSAGQFYTEFVASVGNMTSIAPKAPAPVVNKTEAMPQPTPLSMAQTEGMPAAPAPAPPVAPATPTAVPAVPSPPVALPPAPPREAATQNNRLIFGLLGLLVALGITMGVVALTGRSSSSDSPTALVTPAASGTAPPEAETPPVEATPPPEPEPEPLPAAEQESTTPAASPPAERPTKPRATTKPAGSKPPTQPAAGGTPTATPAPAQPAAPAPSTTPAPSTPTTAPSSPAPTPAAPSNPAPTPSSPPVQPKPTPPAPTSPSAGNACRDCVRAAAGRDFTAASRAYAQCQDASARQQCSNRVAQLAPKAAESAAFNQRCDEAKVIMQAASAMGVPDGRMAKSRSLCK